jgi:hypothetical protein
LLSSSSYIENQKMNRAPPPSKSDAARMAGAFECAATSRDLQPLRAIARKAGALALR